MSLFSRVIAGISGISLLGSKNIEEDLDETTSLKISTCEINYFYKTKMRNIMFRINQIGNKKSSLFLQK